MMILITDNFGATNLPTAVQGVGSRAGTGFKPGELQLHVQDGRSPFFLVCCSEVTDTTMQKLTSRSVEYTYQSHSLGFFFHFSMQEVKSTVIYFPFMMIALSLVL